MNIEVFDHIDEDAMRAVFNGLLEYNERFANRNQSDFTITIKDGDAIIGVAMGESKYDWLILQYLWVDELHRGKGLGLTLLDKIEHLALSRNLLGIHLDTFEFQAKEFYEKAGYIAFGEIKDHPKGYNRYFMLKKIKK